MTPEQFCYWLQGRLEISPEPLNEAEQKMVREHLAAVFHKVTPPAVNPRLGGLGGIGVQPPYRPGDWPAPLRPMC